VGPAATANLNRQPGTYELYNLATGAVVARIANNNGGPVNGTNYRTGASCPWAPPLRRHNA